jgi:hypothetical protein
MHKRMWAALAFSATFIAAAGGHAQQAMSQQVVNAGSSWRQPTTV